MKSKSNCGISLDSFPDALLADLQNTVPGSHLNPVNGTANGTSGYGCLKGARRKEPQVSLVTAFAVAADAVIHARDARFTISRERRGRVFRGLWSHVVVFVMCLRTLQMKTHGRKDEKWILLWKFVMAKILLDFFCLISIHFLS